MASSKESDGLSTLRASTDSTIALVKNFQIALQNHNPSTPGMTDTPNLLRLLSDSASILKAQTTKLSLLILNKPYTPSAITFILNSLSNQCLPALMSALELCTPAQWTSFLQQHLRASLTYIMGQYLDLVASIPTDEHGIDTAAGRGVLANTGVLWESCDKLVELASKGLVSLAIQKADAYHALIKDAIAELEEWDPNELEDDSDSDSDTDPLREQLETTHLKMEGSVHSTRDTTSSIPHLQTLTLSHLRLIRLLYPALRKRRLLTFPSLTSTISVPSTVPSPAQLQLLDAIMAQLKQFSEEADEIVGALYDGNEGDVMSRLQGMRELGILSMEGARLDWGDKEDEFSEWSFRWVGRLKEMEGN